MRLFFVAFVLTATAALAQPLPGQQASRLVLLAGEAGAKALIPPPPPTTPSIVPEDPFAPLYRRMLTMNLQLLEVQRVSLGGPLAATLFGGTAAVVGAAMLLLGLTANYTFFIVGLIMLGASSLPLLVGIPWLLGTMNTNARITREIARVKRELGQLGHRPIDSVDGAVLGTF